jgi:hypothetical protein
VRPGWVQGCAQGFHQKGQRPVQVTLDLPQFTGLAPASILLIFLSISLWSAGSASAWQSAHGGSGAQGVAAESDGGTEIRIAAQPLGLGEQVIVKVNVAPSWLTPSILSSCAPAAVEISVAFPLTCGCDGSST